MTATNPTPASLHPTIAQALTPFVQPLPRYSYGGQTYICERTMREDVERDARSLRLQIQSNHQHWI